MSTKAERIEGLDGIVRLIFGSHLFGTATAASDRDVKGVFVPGAREILAGRAPDVLSAGRAKAKGERNSADDVDVEMYSLAKYLKLLSEGQTNAVDMFFAPDAFHLDPADRRWRAIQARRPALITRKASAFLGYCRQQAKKYSVKGDRLESAQAALDMLEAGMARVGADAPLRALAAEVEDLAAARPFVSVVALPKAMGEGVLPHLEVCDRLTPYTSSVKVARDIVAAVVREYGRRARQAMEAGSVDWKALSHALRVGHEAIELLTTGALAFPRPEAPRLLAVKLGEVPFEETLEEVNVLLAEAEAAEGRSSLPAEVDPAAVEDLLVEIHGAKVLSSLRPA